MNLDLDDGSNSYSREELVQDENILLYSSSEKPGSYCTQDYNYYYHCY